MTTRILVALVDVAAETRELYGDSWKGICPDLPEHDWRFHLSWNGDTLTTENEQPTDGRVTFGRHTTAAQVAAHLAERGQLPSPTSQGGLSMFPTTTDRRPVPPVPLAVGDTIQPDWRTWTVKAVTAHFAALTTPITEQDVASWADAREAEGLDRDEHKVGNLQYTVIDWRNGVRGPCNLSGWGWGDGTYTETECAQMLAAFEAGELEISHRNNVRIGVVDGRLRWHEPVPMPDA